MAAKKSHSEAKYRTTSPFRTKKCADCSMFRNKPENRCTLVEDPIDSQGWCVFFEPKHKESKAA